MEFRNKYTKETYAKLELQKVNRALKRISDTLERAKISEYVDLLNHPKRLIYLNFMAGVFRGVGLAVGFTVLGATLIYVLTRSFVLNLPLVGKFLGELVWIIQQYLRARP